jgi:hypothetical protein
MCRMMYPSRTNRRRPRRRSPIAGLLLAWVLLPIAAGTGGLQAGEPAPNFTNDVMAVLSKAGCNMGACHGNLNGKGGFKLSLRGQDPSLDYATLLREHGGRRVDLLSPSDSLLLLKPTLRLAHEGGRRFAVDSPEYRVLRDWLAAGAAGPDPASPKLRGLEVVPTEQVLIAPARQVPLQVKAQWDDGSIRDVTRLAVYETSNLIATVDAGGMVEATADGQVTVTVRYLDQQLPVRLAFVPQRAGFRWSDPEPLNGIDRHVFAGLQPLRMNPSPLADDSTFIRRAYLDALGILPTADEAREFVADRSLNKRARKIDQLLARPEFADYWALKWSDVLRNEEKVLDSRGVKAFHGWIRDSMASGKPLDQFVRELVSASGSTYDNPPANYYRAERDPTSRGETTARLFLGVRLQCARCHNHPFDRWTQDDYYSWAALFSRIDYKIIENKRTDKLDNNEFVGEQIVLIKSEGEVRNPRTGRDAPPRFLGDEQSVMADDGQRLEPLARWLTARHNRQFAKAQANRVWYHLMGRGLVDPIDDFRVTNPAVNEPLLEALADALIDGNYDLRHLVRWIMNSRTYQTSAVPNLENAEDQQNFSRAIIRRLPAEALLDAQCQVLDVPADFVGYPAGTRAGQIAGVRAVRRRSQRPAQGDRFLFTFGKPERLLACDCERSDETTLAQVFLLLGGQGINDRLTDDTNRLRQLADSTRTTEQLVDEIYWTALSRPPTSEERQVGQQLLDDSQDRLSGLQDLAWAVLNSKEFLFRH